jgi:hypothetical protein
MEEFGFIVSVKRTIVEPSTDETANAAGKAIFFKPNCSGYTADWRKAGLYSREKGRSEERRTHGSCVYVEIPQGYQEEARRQNENPIE